MPDAPEAGEELPLTSSALGEPTTIDPCGLTGPVAFEGVGAAHGDFDLGTGTREFAALETGITRRGEDRCGAARALAAKAWTALPPLA